MGKRFSEPFAGTYSSAERESARDKRLSEFSAGTYSSAERESARDKRLSEFSAGTYSSAERESARDKRLSDSTSPPPYGGGGTAKRWVREYTTEISVRKYHGRQ